MHATDIVAYTYDADVYCPDCIRAMFVEERDPTCGVEDILTIRARERGIDYLDETSYDSGTSRRSSSLRRSKRTSTAAAVTS